MTKFLNYADLEAAVEAVAIELENERKLDAVYIPPEVDCLTDEEDFDDATNEESGKNEIAGTFELHGTDYENETVSVCDPP